jgi:hypothetical protein
VDATVGGGSHNTASGPAAAVGGGENNTADSNWSTVGGGRFNTAGNWYATVGGGYANWATRPKATVGGGESNAADGDFATVPGGEYNYAGGTWSLAAGHRAKARNDGTFVWADSLNYDFDPLDSPGGGGVANSFNVRATGGVVLYTGVDASGIANVGARLPWGSGSWSSISDRNVKANLAPVDGRDVLTRLSAMPIQTWNYTTQDSSVRHIGPMAQDFRAAFGVGEDERYISSVDADGVTFAAIQGLYKLSQEQAGRIQTLEAENAALQGRLDDLEARLAGLERTAHRSPSACR